MISERFKQRLVGILVMTALAIVFIPMLFNFDPSVPLDETSQIPPAPDIEPVSIDEPTIPEGAAAAIDHEKVFALGSITGEDTPVPVAQVAADQPAAKPQPTEVKAPSTEVTAQPTEKAPPTPTPKLTESGLPESWIIQVASYREVASAEQLVQKLQQAGFKAFVRPATSAGVTVHRVYVGPHILRKNADMEKARIDASFGVKSLILPFEP